MATPNRPGRPRIANPSPVTLRTRKSKDAKKLREHQQDYGSQVERPRRGRPKKTDPVDNSNMSSWFPSWGGKPKTEGEVEREIQAEYLRHLIKNKEDQNKKDLMAEETRAAA